MTGEIQTWGAVITNTLVDLWNRIVGIVPSILAAIVILVLGIIVANIIAGIVRRILAMTRVDRLAADTGVQGYFSQRGMKFTFSGLFSWFIKWLLILVVLVSAAEVLGLPQISAFINSIIGYVPNIIVASAILAIGFIAARFLSNLVVTSSRLSRYTENNSLLLGTVSYWAVAVFAVMAALVQLGIAVSLINTLFAGTVAMIAIAAGLAFGLGGRENAKRLLDQVQSDFEEGGVPGEEVSFAAVSECLTGIDFPANKNEVVSYCQDSTIKKFLRNIRNKRYNSMDDVMRSFSQAR